MTPRSTRFSTDIISREMPDFTGIQCSAGKLSVSIRPDGTIFRCGQKTVLGNVFERRLHLSTEDRACDDEYCPYWCMQYSRFDKAAPANYPRRSTPSAPKRTFFSIQAIRSEIGKRIAPFSSPRGDPDGLGSRISFNQIREGSKHHLPGAKEG